MNHLRKKALGLAIAGVIYGVAPSVYADETVSEGGANETYVASGLTGEDDLIFDQSANYTGGEGTALTIGGAVPGDVVINGSIISDADNTETEALEPAIGLVIGDGIESVINNGQISGATALQYNSASGDLSVTNNGLINGVVSVNGVGSLNFSNSGVAYVKFQNSLVQSTSVTNTGTMVLRSGSRLNGGSFNTAGGTTEFSFEDAELGLSTSGGNFVVDASTVIKVSASPTILRTDAGIAGLEALTAIEGVNIEGLSVTNVPLMSLIVFDSDGLPTLASGTLQFKDGEDESAFDPATDSISVEAGNILLKITNPRVTSTGIVVDIETNSVDDIVAGLGFPDVVQQIAEKFQRGITSGDISDIEELYGSLVLNIGSEAALADYLNKIRPDDSGADAEAGVDMANAVSGNISSRGAAVRTGVNTGDMFSADGFWVQGIFGKSEQKSDGADLGYDGKLRGFTIGADRDIDGVTVGLAFSYGNSDTDFNNNRDQNDSVQSYMGSLYSIWQQEDMYVDGSLSLGTSNHESKIWAGSAAETAEYDSWQLGAKGTVGFYMPVGNAMLEPMVSTRMTYVDLDSFKYKDDNDGSYNGNSSGAADFKQMDLGVGAAFSTVLSREESGVYITPRLSVMYFRDVLKDTLNKDISFAGDDYKLKGSSKERDSLEVGLSVDISAGDHVSLSAAYDRVHKDDFSSDNYSFKFRYDF
ncbi:autotransporter outer membrane beta-barrel domain-containing protein [uncultured Endozoicomonas sp.]|uniref:autotransporter family protein n=1 Tax=uncultured Endozoicomonas sp. TaxID=432652 RepID=UPI002607F702|nr:autotransporter outer membrane beta-barrel domain-containing protein [uncultured Endozoicomonas sp.]